MLEDEVISEGGVFVVCRASFQSRPKTTKLATQKNNEEGCLGGGTTGRGPRGLGF
jgi:hypothetical protein